MQTGSDPGLAMGKRLSRLYTRTGDDGTTGLADGSRVAKMGPRITAIGELDELNSHLGVLLSESLRAETGELLTRIQHDLFDLGGELAIPGSMVISHDRVTALEAATDGYNASLGPLREFILPGGGRAGAQAHVARAVCRRAERALAGLASQEPINPQSIAYVNRLSDLLFALARHLNRVEGVEESYWNNPSRTEKEDKNG